MRRILLFIFLFHCYPLSAQTLRFVPSFGITATFGTHIQRGGLRVGGELGYGPAAVNATLQYRYNLRSWPSKRGSEWMLSTGFAVSFGSPKAKTDSFPPSAAERRKYRLGYDYLWYWDKFGSSQRSGKIDFDFGKINFQFENDVLAGQGQDRYRTGAFGFSYAEGVHRFALSVITWTGDAAGKYAPLHQDNAYRSRFGYKDLSNAPYGKISRGILAGSYAYSLPFYGQSVRLRAGVDDERVRHLFQNKFIHDMPMLPGGWIKAKNPHYPMLDESGLPYLEREGLRLRKARLFLEGGVNEEGDY